MILYLHPLSSYCWKALIAFYENGATFEAREVHLYEPEQRRAFLELWPLGKIPLLRDGDRLLPETSVMIEYLETRHPGKLFHGDMLEVRLWDRFFDNYVHTPMQTIVGDRLRFEESRDPHGVEQARTTLRSAYAWLDKHLTGSAWAVGDEFTLADCAGFPPLFYANCLEPFRGYPRVEAYFERLLERPSVARVLAEARPHFDLFPLKDQLDPRFL